MGKEVFGGQGDLDVLDMLLFTGDAENKFPGDINTCLCGNHERTRACCEGLGLVMMADSMHIASACTPLRPRHVDL